MSRSTTTWLSNLFCAASFAGFALFLHTLNQQKPAIACAVIAITLPIGQAISAWADREAASHGRVVAAIMALALTSGGTIGYGTAVVDSRLERDQLATDRSAERTKAEPKAIQADPGLQVRRDMPQRRIEVVAFHEKYDRFHLVR